MAKKKNSRSGNPQKQHHHHETKRSPRVKKVSWIAGARPRTLPLAIAPVVLGAGIAIRAHVFSWSLSGLALAVALFLQIGVNYANDYSDGVRGTDAHRVGPGRLVGSGSRSPKAVLRVALFFLGLAALCGAGIVVITQIWWLAIVGVVAIVAAWFYTGGKRPYGYSGFGELVVFVFFGLVATMGTAFIQMKAYSAWALFAGVGMGLIACAVLMINNIRDIDTDRAVGKKTLAVRIGKRASIVLFCIMLVIPMLIVSAVGLVLQSMMMVQFVWLAVLPAGVIAIWAKTPAEYVTVLKITTFIALAYGVLFGLAIAQPWVTV